MKPLRIMHLGIAVWPSWEIAQRKMWIWMKSDQRFGWKFEYYGVGTKVWPGYRKQKVESQLEWLQRHGTQGATHIHYTDCCDCLVLGPPDEFERKYMMMGCPPMLVQSASQLGNVFDDRYPYFETPGYIAEHGRFRYPCVGGYIMEAQLLVMWLEKMHRDYPPEDPRWGDDCFVWYEGMQQGWFRPEIDSRCELWRVGGESEMEVRDGRLYEPSTDSYPVIWHNSGGSANAETFKDHMMIPMATKLGIL